MTHYQAIQKIRQDWPLDKLTQVILEMLEEEAKRREIWEEKVERALDKVEHILGVPLPEPDDHFRGGPIGPVQVWKP